MANESNPRGKRASFDRASGAARGSGSGAGGGAPGEDYDEDASGGGGADPVGAPRTGSNRSDRRRGAPA